MELLCLSFRKSWLFDQLCIICKKVWRLVCFFVCWFCWFVYEFMKYKANFIVYHSTKVLKYYLLASILFSNTLNNLRMNFKWLTMSMLKVVECLFGLYRTDDSKLYKFLSIYIITYITSFYLLWFVIYFGFGRSFWPLSLVFYDFSLVIFLMWLLYHYQRMICTQSFN